MNRYNETAQEAIKMLNAKPQTDDGGKFKVELRINGVIVPEDNFEPTEWRGNPLSKEQFSIEYYGVDDDSAPTPVNPSVDGKQRRVTSRSDVIESLSGVLCGNDSLPTESSDFNFTYLHLKKVDPNAGTFLYVNDKGTSVTFTKIKSKYLDYVF
jgi:hypothetical protein